MDKYIMVCMYEIQCNIYKGMYVNEWYMLSYDMFVWYMMFHNKLCSMMCNGMYVTASKYI